MGTGFLAFLGTIGDGVSGFFGLFSPSQFLSSEVKKSQKLRPQMAHQMAHPEVKRARNPVPAGCPISYFFPILFCDVV